MSDTQSENKGTRIAKVIARVGYCSRRDAEKLIARNLVYVNGERVTEPATHVQPDDLIEVEGTRLDKPEAPRLFMFHKPKGCLTTTKDDKGRQTVFDIIAQYEDVPRLVSIGRLDYNTEGLLLFTNDGHIARKFELPASKYKRVYRIRAHGQIPPNMIQELAKGVTIEGVRYGSAKVFVEKDEARNKWLEMTITEGKNREVRKIMEHYGLEVNRLIRTNYAGYRLSTLPRNALKEVPLPKEML